MKRNLFLGTIFICLINTLVAVYHKIANYNTPGNATNIELVDDVAFVTLGSDGLEIIDISNPENPVLINNYTSNHSISNIKIVDNTAYIASSDSVVEILDISNPSEPVLLGMFSTSGNARFVEVVNNIAYVAENHDGFEIFDINDYSNPIFLGSYNTEGLAKCIRVVENIAYLADLDEGLQIFDISDPTNPILIGNLDTPSWALDIEIRDNIAYVACSTSGGLQIIDINDPANPFLISYYDTPDKASSVELVEDKAFIGDRRGLQVIDISEPENPFFIANYETFGQTTGVSIVDDIAYLADGSDGGLQIIDISMVENSELIGNYETEHYCNRVSLINTVAFLSVEITGLHIIDFEEPGNPELLSTFGPSYHPFSIFIEEDIGIFLDPSYLYNINLENFYDPLLIGSCSIPGYAINFSIDDNYVYVATDHEGLQIIDNNPLENPEIIGSFDIFDWGRDVVSIDDVVLFIDLEEGLNVINVSDPMNPYLVSTFTTENTMYSISINNDIAYLANGYGGLKILNVSNAENILLENSILPHTDSFISVTPLILENQLIIIDGSWNEILVYDLTDPINPLLLNSYRWNMHMRDIDVSNEFVATANAGYGVSILDLDILNTSTFDKGIHNSLNISLNNYPNPFNPTTTISFDATNLQENARIDIYNLKGQHIREFKIQNLHNKINSVVWDGTDSSGKVMSSGIYFYRLTFGNQVLTKKAILMK